MKTRMDDSGWKATEKELSYSWLFLVIKQIADGYKFFNILSLEKWGLFLLLLNLGRLWSLWLILYCDYDTALLSRARLNTSTSESRLVVSDSLRPHELYSPRNSPGHNTGVGSLSLLQGIFPTKGSNPGLPHCRRIFYQLSHKGSPRTGVGSLSLLQGIFPTQESNWSLRHCRWILYQLSYRGSSNTSIAGTLFLRILSLDS